MGSSEDPALQPLIFGLFRSMYLVTVTGNLLIVLAILSDPHLHTPMYFFLSNLSLVDICFTSTTIPKIVVNIQTQSKAISYAGCISQKFFLIIFAGLDNFLLAVMAYDRFVAICHPLHYTVIMNSRLCVHLVLVCWVISVLHALLQSLLVLWLSFCVPLEILYFFCELNQVAQLTCSDTFLNDMVIYFTPVLLLLVHWLGSCAPTLRSSPPAQGKYKTFSTCASHLSVVSLFYCTGLGVYLTSSVTHNSHSPAMALVMYPVVTPMLNPFIYSLRNKDINKALETTQGSIALELRKH